MAASVNKRCIRKRRNSSDSDLSDEDANIHIPMNSGSMVNDIKKLQSLRSRQHGVSAESLAVGKSVKKERSTNTNDPLKMKTGGMVDMKALKKQKLTDEDREAIGTAFAAETNRRDEDTEMLKYVEKELSKKKGHLKDELPINITQKDKDDIYVVPENLATASKRKGKEGTISSQMLSGIPEVDLGIEAKIQNIEKTEEAKHILMLEKMRKKENTESEFIPTNMAVNFMQHNRFNVEESVKVKTHEPAPKVEPVRVGDVERLQLQADKSLSEKATDDEHYNKFCKKQKY